LRCDCHAEFTKRRGERGFCLSKIFPILRPNLIELRTGGLITGGRRHHDERGSDDGFQLSTFWFGFVGCSGLLGPYFAEDYDLRIIYPGRQRRLVRKILQRV